MQALVLTAPNEFSVTEIEDPVPGRLEVLCRVERVGICGTDVHMIQGHYPGMWPASYPFTPGHEWSGEVIELGEDAESFGFSVGDKVAGTSHAPCGYCVNCVRGRYNICLHYGDPKLHRHYGHTVQGSYADYVVHSIRSVFPVPNGLDMDQAALADPASIALHTVKQASVGSGDTVLVIGAGPIGILAADCAHTLGASRVIFAARGDRVGVVRGLGFETIDTGDGDAAAALRELLPEGVDAVIDAAGTSASVSLAIASLARGGRCATVGIPTGEIEVDVARLVLDEMQLVGARAAAGEMVPVLDLMADGRIRSGDLITHRYPLRDFADAFETAKTRRDGAIKVMIDMSLD